MYDTIIIGAGPAGLTAGIYAVRRGLKTLIVEKAAVGGKILYAKDIENYPGFNRISGEDLADRMRNQAKNLGVEIVMGEVIGMNLTGEVKTIVTREKEYQGKAAIIATGAMYKKLDIKGEEEFAGRGVSFCATCDAPFFRGRIVAVIGGGNTAVDDALYLSEMAKKTYLIHRREKLRSEEIRQEKLLEKGVKLILNTVVEEIHGDKLVNSISIRNVKTDGIKKLKVDGVFVSIGVIPSTVMEKSEGVEVDEREHIVVDRNQETNIPGVFAAGDVTGGIMQISTAVGEGCTAALSAYKYVKEPYWGDKR
jgi:thioredoxin reductase (NADPH)